MAHDFLGTFNEAQFKRFIQFARYQLSNVEDRQRYLLAEQGRVGSIVFRFVRGIPQSVSTEGDTSYSAKLFEAYQIMGGDPFVDLRTRSLSDPIFLERTDENVGAHSMSNGEAVGEKVLADRTSALLMRQIRNWLEETLDHRFNRLERKIRRALDYYDQLLVEYLDLQVIKAAATTPGSLENVAKEIEILLDDPNYRAINRDSDKLGLLTRAPFSSYDITQGTTGSGKPLPQDSSAGRRAPSPQRQNSGTVKPGTRQT